MSEQGTEHKRETGWLMVLPAKVARIARLTRAELGKLFRQRFPYVAMLLTLGISLLCAENFISSRLPDHTEQKPALNGFDAFTEGCYWGFEVGSFLLLILGAMSISSEATMGTLRTVLTRPLKRFDFMSAKFLSLIALAMLVVMVVAAVNAGYVAWRVDFDDVRHPASLELRHTKEVMIQWSCIALIAVILPLAASALFGLLISTLFENNGFSVGCAVLVFLASWIWVNINHNESYYQFNNYTSYYFGTLVKDSQKHIGQDSGKFRRWTEEILPNLSLLFSWEYVRRWRKHPKDQRVVLLSVLVPAGWILLFFLGAHVIFWRRNVLV